MVSGIIHFGLMIDLPSPSNNTYPLSSSKRENTSLILFSSFATLTFSTTYIFSTRCSFSPYTQFLPAFFSAILSFNYYFSTLLCIFTSQYGGIICINVTCTFKSTYQTTSSPVIRIIIPNRSEIKKNPIQKTMIGNKTAILFFLNRTTTISVYGTSHKGRRGGRKS